MEIIHNLKRRLASKKRKRLRAKRDDIKQAIREDRDRRKPIISPEWRTDESIRLGKEGAEIARKIEIEARKKIGKKLRIRCSVVGSVMIGKAHKKSDIDLIVVYSGNKIEKEGKLRKVIRDKIKEEAGKTTRLDLEHEGVVRFINTDELARGIQAYAKGCGKNKRIEAPNFVVGMTADLFMPRTSFLEFRKKNFERNSENSRNRQSLFLEQCAITLESLAKS